MYYKLRYRLATLHGWLKRSLGLMHPDSRTVSEIVTELEVDRRMREYMNDARRRMKLEDEERARIKKQWHDTH